MKNMIIDEDKINKILGYNENPDTELVMEIIEKARKREGLTLNETAVLLQCSNKILIEEMIEAAREIKESIYGNRLVLFAPLYLSNLCNNNCLYCAFRKDNKELVRKKLNSEAIKKETEKLLDQGHKRVLIVSGEGDSDIDYITDAIKTIYSVKHKNSTIRRINVNIAPISPENFRKLKSANIGTYQLFQETYHKETYEKMHPEGSKSDYDKRLGAPDRAMEAGIDDIGIGVLFGLYDYKFEVLALLQHCIYLEDIYGVGPHTISVPRIEPALNAPLSKDIPCPVSDKDFKKIVAIIRMAVPYTGMILSTRETPALRNEVFGLGISQISAGSRTNPGAYAENREHAPESEQFNLGDTRPTIEVVKGIVKNGFFPSFCTACYRLGRTGKDFMDLAKPGDIKDFCLPNCILTFKEYLVDFADEQLKITGEQMIINELENIENKEIRELISKKLQDILNGERDVFI